jgi:pyruvate-formate lyase-activating enzyme
MKKPPFTDKVCRKPFEYLEISAPKEGRIDCYSCCPTILPVKTGDLSKEKISELWNSEAYQKLRASMIDESFTFCNHELCPEIQSDNLLDVGQIENPEILNAFATKNYVLNDGPKEINLSFDEVCNLACPSCRTDFITSNTPEDEQLMTLLTDEILSMDLRDTRVMVCSSGDPFVSQHFRRILFELVGEDHPGLKLQIMTNGLMFNRKSWERMHKVHSCIERTCVSIDASTEKTYQITRKGGNWATLMANLEFLAGLRMRGELSFLRLDFVVQDHNFNEMPDFIRLGERLGVDQVFFQKITDWGTFSPEELNKRKVYEQHHPEYEAFKDMLRDPIFKSKVVNAGNLGDFISTRNHGKFNLRNAVFHSLRKRWRKLKRVVG